MNLARDNLAKKLTPRVLTRRVPSRCSFLRMLVMRLFLSRCVARLCLPNSGAENLCQLGTRSIQIHRNVNHLQPPILECFRRGQNPNRVKREVVSGTVNTVGGNVEGPDRT